MKKTLTLLFVAFATYLSAATILVTNTNDSGAGSLRDAVASANMGDIIRLDQSLLANGSDSIVLASPILIDKGLFFKGLINGADTLFLSGGNSTAIFHIMIPNGVSYPHLDLDSLVFIHGNGTTGTYGGAIQLDNQLFYTESFNFYIRNCVFRDNTAPYGGALGSYRNEASTIYLQKVFLEIYTSTFKNNKATGAGSDGGAIYIYRKRTGNTNDEPRVEIDIFNSNFLSNSSNDQGGAIYVYAESYTGNKQGIAYVTIKESTLHNNHTTNAGGAIFLNTLDSYAGQDSESFLDITSSTITNNSAVSDGGAFYILSSNTSKLTMNSGTLLDNTCLNDGSAAYVKSTGTSNFSENTSDIIMSNSIVAFNTGNFNYNNSIFQAGYYHDFITGGFNIFDFLQSDLTNYFGSFDPDVFSATALDLNLLPLSLNAKKTYTRVPDFGSIAINSSSPFNTDEPQNAPVLGLRDIGAAESAFCDPIPVSETASFCQGSNYDFYGQTLTSAGSYTHTIVTSGACDTIVTLTLSVETPAIPTINITATPGNTIMIGTPVTITASITNGGTTPSYQWYANGNPIGPNAASVITSTLTNGVSVYCVLTSNDACVSPTSVQSGSITFTVHANNDEPCNAIPLDVNTTCVTEYFANHIATATTNVGPHTCASSTSRDIWFSFSAPSSGNVDIYTYAGTLLDAVMSVYLGPNCSSLFEAGCIDDDGTNQMPQGMVTGAVADTTYYIRVSSYGTTASGNFGICVVDAGLNALAEGKSNLFEIYPNPSNGLFTINFKDAQKREVKVFSALGSLIYKESLVDKMNTFNLNHLVNGVYLVEIEEDGLKYNQKIVIEH